MTRPLAENSASAPASGAAPAGTVRHQADLGARPGGVGHLGGHGALPDEVVEAELVAVQLRGRPASGVRKVSPAGRMASWASWAFFTLRS